MTSCKSAIKKVYYLISSSIILFFLIDIFVTDIVQFICYGTVFIELVLYQFSSVMSAISNLALLITSIVYILYFIEDKYRRFVVPTSVLVIIVIVLRVVLSLVFCNRIIIPYGILIPIIGIIMQLWRFRA